MNHNEIKNTLLKGIKSLIVLGELVKNDDIRQDIKKIQKGVLRHLKHGNNNRSI